MATIKKVTYDFGQGPIELQIKVNSKGIFTCDLPMYVNAVTHKFIDETTLEKAEKKLLEIYTEYINQEKRVERLILVRMVRKYPPQFNEGFGLVLNYVVCDRETIGQRVRNFLVNKDMQGNWRQLYNEIGHGEFRSGEGGAIVGKSTEIPFSEEAFAKIQLIESKLKELANLLDAICNDADSIQAYIDGTLQLMLK